MAINGPSGGDNDGRDPEDRNEVEPVGLAAGEELESEALENDPAASINAGMEVGKEANTTDEQVQLEIQQRNAPNVVETVSERDQEQNRQDNPYSGEAVTEARNELFHAENSGSGAGLYAGSIEDAIRNYHQLLLEEKERQHRDFLNALMEKGLSEDLAKLVADYAQMQDDFSEVEDDFSEIMVEATEALESLREDMTELDQEHDGMQAEMEALQQQLDAETDPLKQDYIRNDMARLQAEMDQNRAIHAVYSTTADNVGTQIREAETSIAEARAQMADLDGQIRTAREGGADADAIRALEDQKAEAQRQIAEARAQVQDLSRQVDVTQRIATYEFAVDIGKKEDDVSMCFAPEKQVEIINGRTALISAVAVALADGEISREDLEELHGLTEDAEVTQEDIQNFAAIFGEEGSNITVEGKSGAEATEAVLSAWQELEEMKQAETVRLAAAQTEQVAAQEVETVEAAATVEVIQDADEAITGMEEYGSIQAFMLSNYAPVDGVEGKENIRDVMNDNDRYLRTGEGDLVYISNADQRMYTLGRDESGDLTQEFLTDEGQIAEMNRQIAREGMIPRNYALDSDVGGVFSGMGAVLSGQIPLSQAVDAVTSGNMNSSVDVPEEFSPFDTWSETLNASAAAATVTDRERTITDAVEGQVAEHIGTAGETIRTGEGVEESEENLADIERAQILVQQNSELSQEAALVQARNERLAQESSGTGDEDIWQENDKLDLETPDPKLVAAASAIMNQVEAGQIPASRLDQVLSAYNLTDDQIDTLKEAIERDPDVQLVDDLGPNAPRVTAAVAEPIAGPVAGIIVERQDIQVASAAPDPNGIEPLQGGYVSVLDDPAYAQYNDPNAEYMKPVEASVEGIMGMAKSALDNVIALGQGGGNASGTATDAAPDAGLMMTEEQRLAMQNANMGANATGGGMAG